MPTFQTHRLRAVAAAFALAVVAARGVPADAPARSARMNDILLARSALAALDADPQVRDAAVVVSVVDRVAVIGGAVADPDTARQAERVVRGVAGIADVKNRCFVQSGPDPLLSAVAARMKAAAPQARADGLPAVVYPPRATFQPDFAPPEPLIAARPAWPAKDWRDPPVRGSNPVTAMRISDKPGLLGDPVGPARPNPAAVGSRPAAADLPGVPPGAPVPVRPASTARPDLTTSKNPLSPAEVVAAVAGMRVRDDRFRGLTVEMKGTTAVLSGTAKREADAWALADAVRRLPGVDKVVLGTIRGE